MEGEKMEAELLAVAAKIILSVSVGGFLVLFLYLYELLIWRPKGLRSKLQNQGIRGPPPSFLLGNILAIKHLQDKVQSAATKTIDPLDPQNEDHHVDSICHQWPSRILPHIAEWRNEYGSNYMYAIAHMQQLCITDVELLKELGLCTSLILGTPSVTTKILGPLLGQGLTSSNGLVWAHQRKTIAPELYLAKVKGMMDLIVNSTTSMLKTWEREIETQGGTAEITVDENLRNISGDIVAKACFQSNYSEGEEIFSRLRTLQQVLSKTVMGVEGLFRWLPTNENREIWRLEKEIESMILKVVEKRNEGSYEKDLLQMIVQGAKTSSESGLSHKKFIVDNCKTIFIAAHESTAVAASWSLMLLALHPNWQARVRAEVLEICGDKPLHADMLPRMKLLTMVIREVLRLYSPVYIVAREVFETITLKSIVIPKGVVLQIPIPILHQNPDIWGPDAHKFNPERFANGVLKACNSPQAYMPFGIGPRICVGQHLAVTELKVVLSLILSKFCFSLSPAYRHSPAYKIVVEPEHGVILRMRRL